jgi:hypothetical protein
MARKEKKYHFIYKTTNLLSGKYYIGMHSTDDLEDGYLGSGTRLRYSINKYGKENFKREILEFCETRDELIKRETEIININEVAKFDCINLKVGGQGGFVSEEHMKKCQLAGAKAYILKFNNDENFRKSRNQKSSETIKKNHLEGKMNPKRFKDKKHSDKTKQLISEKMKGMGIGENNSQYGTCWITKDGANKKIKKEEIETYLNEGWLRGRKNN